MSIKGFTLVQKRRIGTQMINVPRVLFLDDEINILKSLKRVLRLHCRDWQFEFCTSSDDALSLLSSFDPWVVVSDKLMPGMDGGDFLRIVSKQKPATVRVLLTGDTSPEVALEVSDVAHMLIAKPFEIKTFVQLLNRAQSLRTLPISDAIRRQLGSIECLPVVPKVYRELTNYLGNDKIETDEIARIISMEPFVLAKLIQLANSAFFAFPRPVTNPHEAVIRFGVEFIKNLVLCFAVFRPSDTANEKMSNRLFSDAMDIALICRQLALACNFDKVYLDQSFILGLLHNIGMLMSDMLSITPQPQENITQLSEGNIVGSYLLALWEFNPEFVNATLYQDGPGQAEKINSLCCILYVAKIFSSARKKGVGALSQLSVTDMSLLKSQGLLDDIIACVSETKY